MQKHKIYYNNIIKPLEKKLTLINNKLNKIKFYNFKRKYLYKKLKHKYIKLIKEKYDEYIDIWLFELGKNNCH